jgi:hypothetical protein
VVKRINGEFFDYTSLCDKPEDVKRKDSRQWPFLRIAKIEIKEIVEDAK